MNDRHTGAVNIRKMLLWTICCALCTLSSGLNAAKIPSDIIVPRLKEIGESLTGGVTGECDELFVSYLEIFDMYAENISAECSLTKEHKLKFENIRGSFYGGEVSGSVSVVLEKEVSYRVDLEFKSVDFQWFSMNFFDPGTRFRGKINGSLSVSGNDEGEVHGTLELKLKNGYIANFPRWFSMFSLMNVNPIRSQKISEARVKLTLSKDTFHIRSCLFRAGDITITGRGHITFDGEADIVLNPRGEHPIISMIPIVGNIVRWLEKGLWRITVKGPLFSPTFRLDPF